MSSPSGQKRIIVIAVDASKQSDEAFNYYCENLHKPDNEVIVLHSPELSNVHMRMLKGDDAPYDEWQKIMQQEKERWSALEKKFTYQLKENNITHGKFMVEPSSKPGEAIVKASNDIGATMVITGTRGQGSLRRTIMGSVSDYVVHHAAVPVIVYRPRK
ncbi:hypothetical protein CAPTEDRAFT_225081 [Capitella teleta]|uniref:UspA domain-containing protein n=1 Tax=Capitella teleta TaxID=283909 RepID=R7U3Z3_CAPTE|nr:hypothetical protein CAPTEDRAFT_225081 [Capitella teleta]|eukprot:ELT98386.1 hypothetical protein CAPTEDRAFT_225081 [Capitella teleta]